ncbi:hypothetical protein ACRAWF_26930 [Streptomyces sp. L7]
MRGVSPRRLASGRPPSWYKSAVLGARHPADVDGLGGEGGDRSRQLLGESSLPLGVALLGLAGPGARPRRRLRPRTRHRLDRSRRSRRPRRPPAGTEADEYCDLSMAADVMSMRWCAFFTPTCCS